MTDYSVLRSYHGQPWVTKNGEKLEGEHKRNAQKSWFLASNATAYARVSGVAKILDDSSGLVDWAACAAAVGVVRDPGLMAGVSALASQHADPWNVPEAKKPLKELVFRARQRGGGSQASDIGTAYHTYSEMVDAGNRPEFMPDPFPALIAEYERCKKAHGLEVVETELFVVNDELELAGSLDALVRLPDGLSVTFPATAYSEARTVDLGGRVVVADKKSGKHDAGYPLSVTVQTAVYSHSVRYDQGSGVREGLHPDLEPSVALLLHHPVRSEGARCVPYLLDADRGFELARLAGRVRAETKFGKLKPMEAV